MRLNDEALRLSGSDPNKKGTKCGLRPWVQVNLRLLKEVEATPIRHKRIYENRQNLTDTVTNIHQVRGGSLYLYANLERIALMAT